MSAIATRLALKERLPRAWPAFFERHGTFTAAQLGAIPPLLEGHNVVVCAATASGKTEAAMAPLVERHCRHDGAGLSILYVVPTRALVNDLAARLARPLETLRISLGVRTGDVSTFRPARPPRVLITTPESVDALLSAHARVFATLRAVVIDELHLLDGTPRGDQVRVTLNRLRRIRAYARDHGDASDDALQFVALSATLAHPASVAARYCVDARIVRVEGRRAIEAEEIALAPEGVGALLSYLDTFRARGWRKALAFCNTRAEVESYAAAVRERSPFGGEIYVHYSNIEARRRRETERQFAGADAALLFASSTLELGIDIGDIDVVLLIGPPGSTGSYLQRIGRGNRRGGVTRVAQCYRTPLERHVFDALAEPDDASPFDATGAPFHPAVAIQQIFSLIKASPTGALRLAELVPLFAGMVAPGDLLEALANLQDIGYLAAGRPGEWRAGPRLDDLFDSQERPHCPLSIYSNIQGQAGRTVEIRDQHTGQTVATVDRQWFDRPVLTLEGRPVNVEWQDGEAIWVATTRDGEIAERLRYRSERQLLSYDVAAALPRSLGLPAETAPFVRSKDGWLWFHWLGDVYGRALFDLLRYRIAVSETAQPGLCLAFTAGPGALPALSEAWVVEYLEETYREWERLLALGPFERLLPLTLRRRAVVAAFDAPRFLAALARLRPSLAPEALSDELSRLLV